MNRDCGHVSVASMCNCPWWLSRPCYSAGEAECECFDECCNTGRYANDGDGYEDFMPERNACGCRL